MQIQPRPNNVVRIMVESTSNLHQHKYCKECVEMYHEAALASQVKEVFSEILMLRMP